MGEVWRAEHQLLARPAAIKLIRTDNGASQPTDEARARFEQEAQVTASLRSPHTIHLYDFGVTDDGAFYYVMELLEGFDLQALVERFGPVPVNRAVYLLDQICHSLAEAHHRGVVHRDIKPSNIFVCRYGRDCDFVKVLDFGLVKPMGSHQGATQQALTAEAVTRGTPAFMSPEQALADPSLDARSDLYALGCVAFWLVTGKPVFQGTSPIDTIVRHVQAVPDAPSRHSELAIPPRVRFARAGVFGEGSQRASRQRRRRRGASGRDRHRRFVDGAGGAGLVGPAHVPAASGPVSPPAPSPQPREPPAPSPQPPP